MTHDLDAMRLHDKPPWPDLSRRCSKSVPAACLGPNGQRTLPARAARGARFKLDCSMRVADVSSQLLQPDLIRSGLSCRKARRATIVSSHIYDLQVVKTAMACYVSASQPGAEEAQRTDMHTSVADR